MTHLILHPTERDPYGVRTVDKLHTYARYLEIFREGYLSATQDGCFPYATARETLQWEFDLPYDEACQVALWVTRPNELYFLSFPRVLV